MQHVVFFDGVCNLCNSSVQFIIRHDKKNIFQFSALQSEAAAKYLPGKINELNTMYYLENGKVYSKSDAILRIAKNLGGIFPFFYGFIVVPKFLRNKIYDIVARNRYKWFGKKDHCMLPRPELQQKFLN